jgi:hypothetical protein
MTTTPSSADKDALSGGQDTGWDVVTLTDWMAQRLVAWLAGEVRQGDVAELRGQPEGPLPGQGVGPGNVRRAVAVRHGRPRLRETVTRPLTSVKARTPTTRAGGQVST